MRVRLAVALLILAAACAAPTGSPSPSAGNFDDVIANLVLRGVTVHQIVSGDAGCPASDLHDNATRLEVSIGTMSSTRTIHLLRWRRVTDFDSAKADFDACVADYGAAHPGAQISAVESRPWRAFGHGWPAGFSETIADALRASGGA